MWLKDKIVCCRRKAPGTLPWLGFRREHIKNMSLFCIQSDNSYTFSLQVSFKYSKRLWIWILNHLCPSLTFMKCPPCLLETVVSRYQLLVSGYHHCLHCPGPSTNKPPLTVTSLHSPVKISATDIPNHLYHCLNQSSSVSPTEFGTVKMRKIQWGHV